MTYYKYRCACCGMIVYERVQVAVCYCSPGCRESNKQSKVAVEVANKQIGIFE